MKMGWKYGGRQEAGLANRRTIKLWRNSGEIEGGDQEVKIEPPYYCYHMENGHILYRKVQEGKWGCLKEKDSVFNPDDVKKWYDSMDEAIETLKEKE
jgi:hypothetical protein